LWERLVSPACHLLDELLGNFRAVKASSNRENLSETNSIKVVRQITLKGAR